MLFFYYQSAWFIYRRVIICTPARTNRPLTGRLAAMGTSRGVSQSRTCRLFSGEVERVKAKWQGKMKSAGSQWPTGYSSFLHPLDLKETHVGVVPDRWIHITTVRGKTMLNSQMYCVYSAETNLTCQTHILYIFHNKINKTKKSIFYKINK